MEVVQKNILDSPALLHLVALPVVIVCTWVFGTFPVWGSLVVVYVLFLARQASKRKITIDTYLEGLNNDRATEHCEWLNMFIRKYWVTSMPRILEPIIANLQVTLRENKPGFLHSLAIGKWHPGVRPPRFEVIYPNLELSDDHHQFDVLVNWASDMFITVCMVTPTRQTVEIRVDGIKFKGMVRMNFNFHALFPSSGVIGVSFVDDPNIEFSVKPVGGFDILSMPMIHDWIDDIIKASIKPILQWPQELQFTMGGGAPDRHNDRNEPIVDIGLVWADELEVPAGWIVVSKASCGSIPANLNSGSERADAKEVYLCYKRSSKKKVAKDDPPKPIDEAAADAAKVATDPTAGPSDAASAASIDGDEAATSGGADLSEGGHKYSMFAMTAPPSDKDKHAIAALPRHKELPGNALFALLRASKVDGTNVTHIELERLPDSGSLSIDDSLESVRKQGVELSKEVEHLVQEHAEEEEEETEPDPITGISLVFPSKGEGVPHGFEKIERTVSNKNDGNLNVGTKAPPCYLAVSRKKIAPPIVGIGVLNRRTATDPPLNHVSMELTPHGRVADINQGEGDQIMLTVKGGAASILGHATGVKERGVLRVRVLEARQMVAADVGGTSDPFCSVEVYGSKKKFKTAVKDKTLNPKWDETFIMAATRNDVLQVYTYDKDAIGKDDYLGGVFLDLNTLRAGEEVTSWYPLLGSGEETGDIKLSICAIDFGLQPGDELYDFRGPLPVSTRSDEIDPKRIPWDEREKRVAQGIPSNRVEFQQLHTIAMEEEEEDDDIPIGDGVEQSAKMKLSGAVAKIGLLSKLKSAAEEVVRERQGVLRQVDDSLLSSNPFGKKKDAFYVLNGKRLLQYKNEKAHAEGKSFQEALQLAGAVVEVDESKGYRFCLKDATVKKKWTFQCTEGDFQGWLDDIRHNIAVLGK